MTVHDAIEVPEEAGYQSALDGQRANILHAVDPRESGPDGVPDAGRGDQQRPKASSLPACAQTAEQ